VLAAFTHLSHIDSYAPEDSLSCRLPASSMTLGGTKDPASFANDFTRQDAAILNIQRACEAALDMGQHLIRLHKLGVPQSSRDVFNLLATAGFIDSTLAEQLKKMIGFRNIAVHEYQRLQLPITAHIIQHRLGDFREYVTALLKRQRGAG